MTVRPSVHTPNDLRGKTIALQLYSPHGLYANILSNADSPVADNLTMAQGAPLPTYDTQGTSSAP
jgi:hypothetical protein